MICGMEIGLAIFGLLALVRGKMTISKTKVVVGVPARLLGLLALTPMPIAFAVVALFAVAQGQGDVEKAQKAAEDNRVTLIIIEAAIVIGIAIVLFVIAAMVGVHPKEAERRERVGRYDDEEDEYEDDRDDRRGRDDRNDSDDRDDRRPKPWQR